MPDDPSRSPEPTGGRERAPELAHTVKRHAIGGPTVHYECPTCETPLHSKLSEAGERETCPHCGEPFAVPGVAEREAEAERAAASERAAREAERMKEAARRIEEHHNSRKPVSNPARVRDSRMPPSAPSRMGSFILYEIVGAVVLIVGIVVVAYAFAFDTAPQGTHNIGLLNTRTNLTIAGSIFLAGGLTTMAASAVGGVLCYCAERLHAIERLQKRAQSAGPPSPREGAGHSR